MTTITQTSELWLLYIGKMENNETHFAKSLLDSKITPTMLHEEYLELLQDFSIGFYLLSFQSRFTDHEDESRLNNQASRMTKICLALYLSYLANRQASGLLAQAVEASHTVCMEICKYHPEFMHEPLCYIATYRQAQDSRNNSATQCTPGPQSHEIEVEECKLWPKTRVRVNEYMSKALMDGWQVLSSLP